MSLFLGGCNIIALVYVTKLENNYVFINIFVFFFFSVYTHCAYKHRVNKAQF